MRITWTELRRDTAAAWQGRMVEIEGWLSPADPEDAGAGSVLTEEPVCCAGCLPAAPERRLHLPELTGTAAGLHRLRGVLRLAGTTAGDWWCELQRPVPAAPAAIAPGFTRRDLIAGGLAAGLAAWMPLRPAQAAPDAGAFAAARRLLDGQTTMDLHSHGGSLIGLRRIREKAPFSPLAAPMREGGMAAICLAVVADSPATRVEDKRIRPYRDPDPGELYAYAGQAFARLFDLVRSQELGVVASRADLQAATPDRPSVIVSSEGGDFLEGRTDRVDEAFAKWHLRHLQLTHYRVNELGDIQTEPPVHGGLTAAGEAVIRRCNRLGIVVDVAHGTYDLVKRAAAVTDKPLVLSHTSLNPKPGRYSRTIGPDHARVIAETDGVIGIWPPSTIYPDLAAMAEGMARMVEVAGIDHVGLGSDMMGLLSPAVLPGYDQLPGLAAALLAQGFSKAEMLKLLGGNIRRVFLAGLPA